MKPLARKLKLPSGTWSWKPMPSGAVTIRNPPCTKTIYVEVARLFGLNSLPPFLSKDFPKTTGRQVKRYIVNELEKEFAS